MDILRRDTAKHYRNIHNIMLAHKHAGLNRIKAFNILYFYGLLLLIALCLTGCDSTPAFSYTLDQYANAIHKAEGNDNYGILKTYKHTTYRQACKNTVYHNYKRWKKSKQNIAFVQFLGQRYCPIRASNDPTGLNRFWVKNVTYWLKKG